MAQQELPRTSRVNDKILEYYVKYGRDRDLEKFMRLYSPKTESSKSRSSASSCEEIVMGIRRLFEDASQRHISTNSLPNMNLEDGDDGDEVNISICVEKGTAFGGRADVSCSEMTPPKNTHQTKETQTPESIGKSHKRLEWDSMADVGYKKSMSTSNISVLERSLLRDLFHEHSTLSTKSHSHAMNVSEGDLKRLRGGSVEQEQEQNNTRTPPLASSTFVDDAKLQRVTGTKPKTSTQSQGTSTSLLKQYEKYAQTSMEHRPQLTSQEVQVNMSSTSASNMGSSATPSSFEYYSSRSSNSASITSSAHCRRLQKHPFVNEINQALAQRRVLSDMKFGQKNVSSSSSSQQYDPCAIEKLHETIKQALDENKENTTTSQLLRSPQLDLGIQLLCSLIDSRSLTSKRKKQLVREIVKRISRLDVECDTEQTSSVPDSSVDKASSVRDSSAIKSSSVKHSSVSGSKSSAKYRQRDSISSKSMGERIPKSARNVSSGVKERDEMVKKPSPPETSAKALANLVQMQARKEEVERKQKLKELREPDKSREETPIESTKPITTSKKVLNVDKSVGTEISPAASAHTITSSSATTTTPSKELITQKAAANDSNTDTEQMTMREWLNPMTQSEIEYEEKKRMHMQKDKRKVNKERVVQLNWIEGEIYRLESLRHLLLKQDDSTESPTPREHKSKEPKNKIATEKNDEGKIYDTVYSDTNASSVPSEKAEQTKKIEVIIEESHEDVMDVNGKEMRTKEHTRKTQVIYDKPATEGGDYSSVPQNKARYRTMKETVVTNEKQLEEDKLKSKKTDTAPVKQRSKIDTPTSSDSINGSESVGSFVQQRKREFLEKYKSKKKLQQEALVQQQRRQQQRDQRYNRANTFGGMVYNHYPVPPIMMPPHTYPHMGGYYMDYNNFHNYPPPPPPLKPPTSPTQPPPPPPPPPMRAARSMAVATSLTSTQSSQQYSTSSVLCVSSEISIPMGSTGISSTPTTTHQYDHVAVGAAASPLTAGVGIQTTDSLLRSQPIFGRREQLPNNVPATTTRITYGASNGQMPVSVQVKPKPIAYVIQFDNKETSDNSDTTIRHMPSISVKEQDPLTLQEHLERARPEFVAQSKERKAILNQIQSLRQEREREMREIVENTSFNSLERNLGRLPPPPTKQVRVFPTKEMKAITSKRVANLPEVLQRKQREREDKLRVGNRILREVFNRRLQRRVRSGKLTLNHSRTVI